MATAGATGASDHGDSFKWSKSADQILAFVKRFCQKTENTLCGELWIHITRATVRQQILPPGAPGPQP
jgi:hypothetical protein